MAAADRSAVTGLSATELQHQRNKEQFDRLFGKVKRDSNLRNHSSSSSPAKGVSLATILQHEARPRPQQFGEEQQEQSTELQSGAPVQSTLVSQFREIINFVCN